MTIRLVNRPDLDRRSLDAKGLGLRVERDGVRYQYFRVVATGQQIDLDHPGIAQHPDFWRAGAVVGARQVRDALTTVEPFDDPTIPMRLPLDFRDVERVLSTDAELPELVEGIPRRVERVAVSTVSSIRAP